LRPETGSAGRCRPAGRGPGVAFLAALEQHLQADADAKEGLGAGRLDDRLARPARGQLAHAVGHCALTGHHDPLRGPDGRRIGGSQNLGAGGDMLQRLRHRAQVPHAVIDDGNPQLKGALVEGTLPAARGSGSAAMRNARANALNTVSHW